MTPQDKLKEWAEKFGKEVILRARRNLGATQSVKEGDKVRKRRRVASGKLQNSLVFSLKERTNGTIGITFTTTPEVQDYAGVIEYGRRKGAKQPPPDALKKWFKEKNVRLRDRDGNFIKRTKKAEDQAAFLIGRSIKKRGIMGIKYYESAIVEEIKRMTPEMLDEYLNAIDTFLELK